MKQLIRRFVSFLTTLALLCASAPRAFGVSAAAYCLMDADTGEILKASREEEERPMASTTKIMTCLVAIREGDLRQTVSVPACAVGVEGSSVYLVSGEKLPLLDLLYALMLQSANDAAVAIAVAVSGSVEAFVDRMNETAAELGLSHTRFADPHGLSSKGHYSSAKDLCRLMAAAMRDETFSAITAEKVYKIPSPDGGVRTVINHNRLLRSEESCVGGKTGFTKAAGRCLVTAFRRSGKTLVCATLNDPDDWNDHRALFAEGFSQYREVEFCQFAGIRQELPVVGGELYTVPVTNLDGVKGMVRGPEEVQMVLELPHFLYAPVPGIEFATDGTYVLRRAGVSVGDAVFYQGTKEVARVPLYPMMNVGELPRKKGLFERIGDWFRSLWERIRALWKK